MPPAFFYMHYYVVISCIRYYFMHFWLFASCQSKIHCLPSSCDRPCLSRALRLKWWRGFLAWVSLWDDSAGTPTSLRMVSPTWTRSTREQLCSLWNQNSHIIPGVSAGVSVTSADSSRSLLFQCLWGLFSEHPADAVERTANQWIRVWSDDCLHSSVIFSLFEPRSNNTACGVLAASMDITTCLKLYLFGCWSSPEILLTECCHTQAGTNQFSIFFCPTGFTNQSPASLTIGSSSL